MTLCRLNIQTSVGDCNVFPLFIHVILNQKIAFPMNENPFERLAIFQYIHAGLSVRGRTQSYIETDLVLIIGNDCQDFRVNLVTAFTCMNQ